LNDPTITSEFVSVSERIVKGCKYTRWSGPTFTGVQQTYLLEREEIIVTNVQDAIYSIKYDIKGKATLWRPSRQDNIATRVVDVNGEFASCLRGKGELFIYGFYFPMVMELNMGGKASIKISIAQYIGENTPLFLGVHDGYKVIYNTTIQRYERIVDPKYQAYSNCIREKYLSLLSEPCVGSTSSLSRNSRLLGALRIEQNLQINESLTDAYGECGSPLHIAYKRSDEPIVFVNGKDVLTVLSPGKTLVEVNTAIELTTILLCNTSPVFQMWEDTTGEQYTDITNGNKVFITGRFLGERDGRSFYQYEGEFTVILEQSVQPIFTFVNVTQEFDVKLLVSGDMVLVQNF
jgi:hypothetical protein